MKLKRWVFRDADTRGQLYRQLAVGLITGGVIGLSFMPTLQFHIGIIPIVFGAYFGLIGALEREEDKS